MAPHYEKPIKTIHQSGANHLEPFSSKNTATVPTRQATPFSHYSQAQTCCVCTFSEQMSTKYANIDANVQCLILFVEKLM